MWIAATAINQAAMARVLIVGTRVRDRPVHGSPRAGRFRVVAYSSISCRCRTEYVSRFAHARALMAILHWRVERHVPAELGSARSIARQAFRHHAGALPLVIFATNTPWMSSRRVAFSSRSNHARPGPHTRSTLNSTGAGPSHRRSRLEVPRQIRHIVPSPSQPVPCVHAVLCGRDPYSQRPEKSARQSPRSPRSRSGCSTPLRCTRFPLLAWTARSDHAPSPESWR